MAFGGLGVAFGRLGASAGHSGSLPTAPVLALIVVSGSTATLTIDVDDTVVAGDTVTLQTQATGGDWSGATTTTHTISSGEDTANEIDLSLSMAAGTYDSRVRVTHGGKTSNWSNTVSFTITASDDDDYAAWLAAA